jgi:hypothetical protein
VFILDTAPSQKSTTSTDLEFLTWLDELNTICNISLQGRDTFGQKLLFIGTQVLWLLNSNDTLTLKKMGKLMYLVKC